MSQEKRQQPIPVTLEKRALLDQYKTKYEEQNGKTDWGNFLGTIALLGLAAAGIYALTKGARQTPQSANVKCTECQQTFVMALPANTPNIVQVKCPHCQRELVVTV